MFVTRQQLIEGPRDLRPHVVLLGAGASRAAFPSGDAGGRMLPLMTDLVEIVGLQPLLEKTGQPYEMEANFEAIYGRLASKPSCSKLIREIERCIDAYFAALSLPSEATLYDRLLVSLRPTDAVFTFNWDPFLFDAYQRNRFAVPLPEIFFLHGNVRIGMCRIHNRWGARGEHCPDCLKTLTEIPLLYPIEQKDYSSDSYLRRSWDAAKALFAEAFTLTIFGYGAPASDKDAVELLRSAWLTRSNRKLEHIEIIDNEQRPCLDDRWAAFAPTLHYIVEPTFERSRLSRWPRRSRESLIYPMTVGLPCEDFPLPATDSLNELQEFSAHIARYENQEKERVGT